MSITSPPLKFSLGGVPAPGSPLSLSNLLDGQSVEHDFTTARPTDQGQSLAIACVELFDSDVPNNCRTLQITRSSGDGLIPALDTDRVMTTAEICAQVLLLLQEIPGSGVDESFTCEDIDPPLTRSELQSLLSQLRTGQAGPVTETEFSAGTESSTPMPGLEPPAPSQGEQLSQKDACAEIVRALDEKGYELEGFDCTELDPLPNRSELAAILAALAGGTAQVALSGPSPYDSGDSAGIEESSGLDTPPEEETKEPAEGEGMEWSGFAVPLADAVSHINIRSNREWKRLWKRVSEQKLPKVDFDKLMVVGVAAGGADHSERADIVEVREAPAGLKIVLRLVRRQEEFPKGSRDAQAPYHLKAITKTDLKLIFEKAPEAEEGAKKKPARKAKNPRKKGKKR